MCSALREAAPATDRSAQVLVGSAARSPLVLLATPDAAPRSTAARPSPSLRRLLPITRSLAGLAPAPGPLLRARSPWIKHEVSRRASPLRWQHPSSML